ncbi:MAG: hypothetical protein JWO90_2350, partial [Solirubrobacterales bacterium]|nr:hypothetical protein [Solirubrobacterales bacterium]
APPVAEPAAGDDASLAAEPTPTVAPADATPDTPAGTAAPESDWLEPDVGAAAATPEPDPVVRTPDAFTPLGTPEPSGPPPVLQKAQEFAEKPEGKVALAFAGGVVASFLLKKLGR